MLEKTAVDAVSVNAMLSDLYKATLGTDAIARRHWDAGAAKFIGDNMARSNTTYNVVLSSTVYDRANFRAQNYGTVLTDGRTANANKKVIDALTAGAAATSTSLRVVEFQKIVAQVKVIYAQCTLRYAFFLDQNPDDLGNQAEGQAFWRVLAPWVKEVDANGAAYLEGIFDINRPPAHTNHFCHAKEVLAKLDITASDMGTLENTESINCDGKSVPANAADYFADSPNDAKNAVTSGASLRAAASTTTVAAVACSVALALNFAW